MDELYTLDKIDTVEIPAREILGKISERDKFKAAKLILVGLATLYICTLIAYLIRPEPRLLELPTNVFLPIATLILGVYFRDKQ